MSRWIEIYATTPSGKTLFVCKMCGRRSVAPDRQCAEPPTTTEWKLSMACHMLEEIEAAIADDPEPEVKAKHLVLMLGKRRDDGSIPVVWGTAEEAGLAHSTMLYGVEEIDVSKG